MTSLPDRPPFESLPLDPNGPSGNAWGLYGASDALGALNLLTPAVVAAASRSEIRTGERVSLDWHLSKPSHPSFGRPPFQQHRIVRKHPDGTDKSTNDDFVSFNTQCSSQWDGFRHYGGHESQLPRPLSVQLEADQGTGYQSARRFYNGHAIEEFDDPGTLGIDGESTIRTGLVELS